MPDQSLLDDAASSLEAAAAGTANAEAAARLDDLSEQLEGFVESGRTPDHGRLARILNAMDETETNDVSADIAQAREHLLTYREDVDGV